MREFDLIEMGFEVGDTVWEMGERAWRIEKVDAVNKCFTVWNALIGARYFITSKGQEAAILLPTFFPNRFEISEAAFEKPRPELAVDTPIWVRDSDNESWKPRHFCSWGHTGVAAFDGGRTSHTQGYTDARLWQQYRLTDPKEGKNEPTDFN
jgi:hypothetical protein